MSNDAHEGLVIPLPASPIFKILQAMSANDMSALHAYATEFKNLSAPQQEVSDKPLAVLVREWNTWAEKQRTPSEAPVKVGTVHTAYKFEEIVYVIQTLVEGEPHYFTGCVPSANSARDILTTTVADRTCVFMDKTICQQTLEGLNAFGPVPSLNGESQAAPHPWVMLPYTLTSGTHGFGLYHTPESEEQNVARTT